MESSGGELERAVESVSGEVVDDHSAAEWAEWHDPMRDCDHFKMRIDCEALYRLSRDIPITHRSLIYHIEAIKDIIRVINER